MQQRYNRKPTNTRHLSKAFMKEAADPIAGVGTAGSSQAQSQSSNTQGDLGWTSTVTILGYIDEYPPPLGLTQIRAMGEPSSSRLAITETDQANNASAPPLTLSAACHTENGDAVFYGNVQTTEARNAVIPAHVPGVGDHASSENRVVRVGQDALDLLAAGEMEHIDDVGLAYDCTYDFLARTINDAAGIIGRYNGGKGYGPFSSAEEAKEKTSVLVLSGLPEMLQPAGNEDPYAKWYQVYVDYVLRTEIRDFPGGVHSMSLNSIAGTNVDEIDTSNHGIGQIASSSLINPPYDWMSPQWNPNQKK